MKLPALLSRRSREIEVLRGEVSLLQKALSLAQPSGWRMIWDTFAGQWQQDVEISVDSVLTNSAVFACIRLIATDIGKLRIRLMEQSAAGNWKEITVPAFSPVLRKPNSFQTRIKFFEQWMQSKLINGNAYVLKSRDGRGNVVQMNVLDPRLCVPLISDSGEVYYQLMTDRLAGIIESQVVVPAREIIHDVHMTPNHPLIGVSPIGACGLAATQGTKIQRNSSKFFANQSRPSFVLSAPGNISDETAARLKASWEANFSGENYGRTAILGDGLEPKSFTITAEDSQLIEQLRWTAEDVCRAFGVPAYKVGVGALPAYNNIEAMDQAYYNQTLQEPIECIELLLDEGLALPTGYGTEFDLDGLIRMDSLTQANVNAAEIRAGYLSPNEARGRRNLDPVDGGDSPLSQQQNYSLAALAKRDASADPFGTAGPAAAPPDPFAKPNAPPPPDKVAAAKALLARAMKSLERAA